MGKDEKKEKVIMGIYINIGNEGDGPYNGYHCCKIEE